MLMSTSMTLDQAHTKMKHSSQPNETMQSTNKPNKDWANAANVPNPKRREDTVETQQPKYINSFIYETKQTLDLVVIWIVQRCMFPNLGGPLLVQPPTTDSMPRFMTDPHEIRVDEESKLTLHGLLQYYVPWREKNFMVQRRERPFQSPFWSPNAFRNPVR